MDVTAVHIKDMDKLKLVIFTFGGLKKVVKMTQK